MNRFEQLPVWQEGRELAKRIYATTRREPFCRDTGLCSQVQRASVSVVANIAEGHERGTTGDLIQFLGYAKASAGEVRAQLYVAEDLGYLMTEEAAALRALAAGIGRSLWAWMRAMQAPGFRRRTRYRDGTDGEAG